MKSLSLRGTKRGSRKKKKLNKKDIEGSMHVGVFVKEGEKKGSESCVYLL